MFVSFIIPCYRESRQQLDRALDSLLFLNSLCEWEAWIVDDGSSEAKVCDWVAARNDVHLHAFRQTNQGPSLARNAALQWARGEYVAFLDADDELIPSEYAKVIALAMNERPDAVGLRYKSTETPYFDGEAADFMCRYDIVPCAWAYVIRRDVLDNLGFTPGIYHEDEEFVTRMFLGIHRIIMTTIVAYRYNATPGSITKSRDKAHLNKRFDDLLGVIRRMQGLLEELTDRHGIDSLVVRALDRRIHVMAMCVVVNLIRDAYSSSFVRQKLTVPSSLNLYPLPSCKGINRYGWIRLLSWRPWMVVLWHRIVRLTTTERPSPPC
ncbi:MAG: glycosyltransferase family 2 protein [Bacteroidales bacterium]|nr:glycosyltransferase family 2 protein [Bacteroidales bacterium]